MTRVVVRIFIDVHIFIRVLFTLSRLLQLTCSGGCVDKDADFFRLSFNSWGVDGSRFALVVVNIDINELRGLRSERKGGIYRASLWGLVE